MCAWQHAVYLPRQHLSPPSDTNSYIWYEIHAIILLTPQHLDEGRQTDGLDAVEHLVARASVDNKRVCECEVRTRQLN